VALRPATVEDIPSLHAVFLAAIGGLYGTYGLEPPGPPLAVFENQQRHILATGGVSVVAIRGGAIEGFASAWSRGDDWFLASLFVSPDAQARGLGSSLLAAVWGDRFTRRRTITDAIQPVSNALYARHGLVPATPVLSFSGLPTAGAPTLVECVGDLQPIDAAGYGFDRAVDHVYWGGLARRTVWAQEAGAIAYSYSFPGGCIGPIAGLDGDAAAAALDSELSRADGPVVVRIPGSARQLVEVAVRRGLRLSPTPGLLLLSAEAQPPEALVLAGYTLF
jgi:hypothetical protein